MTQPSVSPPPSIAVVRDASSAVQLATAAWGVLAVAAIFLECIARLGARAMQMMRADPSPSEWVLLGLVMGVFGYGEGYLALHERFAPRVVERAFTVPISRWSCLVLAPLYVTSLIGADRRTLAKAWIGVALIAAAATIVHALPPPWRQLIDAGVAFALSIGLLSLMGRFAQRTRARVRCQAPPRAANEDGRKERPPFDTNESAATQSPGEKLIG